MSKIKANAETIRQEIKRRIETSTALDGSASHAVENVDEPENALKTGLKASKESYFWCRANLITAGSSDG